MYRFYVGIDVSKRSIDVAFKDNGRIKYLGHFSNDHKGFKSTLNSVASLIDTQITDGFFCFENSGVYSKALLEYLVSQQLSCREESPIQIKRSTGLKRGKNDKVDAMAICQYAFEKRDSIQPSELDKPLIVRLKKLLSQRDLYVRQKNAALTSFKEGKELLDNSILDLLTEQTRSLVDLYEQHIKAIEQSIEELMGQNEQMNKNNQLIQSLKGVGPVIAAYFIAYTNNFSRFDNARQFASYCGIAPFPNQSGTYKGRNKVSHMANKKMKSLLSNAVLTAAIYDPQIKRYKQQKLVKGKPKGVVYNNIKNKIVHRVFAVVRRQSPYVLLP